MPMTGFGKAGTSASLDICIRPLSLVQAIEFSADALSLDEDGVLTGGGHSLALKPVLSLVNARVSAPAKTAAAQYDLACDALASGEAEKAAQGFAEVLSDPELRVGAAYGLACSLTVHGALSEGVALATLIAGACPEHPVFSALAGHCAAQQGDITAMRQHLARAARRARGVPEFRELLHFAQRTLLIQQFGD